MYFSFVMETIEKITCTEKTTYLTGMRTYLFYILRISSVNIVYFQSIPKYILLAEVSRSCVFCVYNLREYWLVLVLPVLRCVLWWDRGRILKWQIYKSICSTFFTVIIYYDGNWIIYCSYFQYCYYSLILYNYLLRYI